MSNHDPQILEENDQYWVLYKPAGWFVHPPSDARAKKQFANFILTNWFYRNHRVKAFPIHRLDFATEGVMIWAKNSESAGLLNELHMDERLKKTYHAVVRGHTSDQGEISIPLLSDSSPLEVECLTQYQTLARIELPVQVNSQHPTSRYSLVEVTLKTGRWHQIRRHFNRIAHPLIGDREHGDSHHNRFFRDELKLPGLLLRATSLEFINPFTQKSEILKSLDQERWRQVEKFFSVSLM